MIKFHQVACENCGEERNCQDIKGKKICLHCEEAGKVTWIVGSSFAPAYNQPTLTKALHAVIEDIEVEADAFDEIARNSRMVRIGPNYNEAASALRRMVSQAERDNDDQDQNRGVPHYTYTFEGNASVGQVSFWVKPEN
jgi:hypothetical protein